MAGTAKKVIISGIIDEDLRQIANSLNQLITDYDAHTHASLAQAAFVPTTAGKIHDALSAAQGAV